MDHLEEASKLLISTGKYKNKTLKEVYEADLNYCLKTLRRNVQFEKYINTRYVKDVNSSKEEFDKLKLPAHNVTTLTKQLKPYHHIRIYDCFGEHDGIQKKQVHEGTSYSDYIIKRNLYSANGVFYDYLIRKYVFNLKNEYAFDSRAETMIDQGYTDYELDYAIYQDKTNQVLDILPTVYRVSCLHRLFFGDKVEDYNPMMLNLENIKTTLNYISSLKNIESSLLNPACGGIYFAGDADMLIDDTIIDFKVSKNAGVGMDNFLQLVFYAAGFYINEGKEMRKFLIYNPLLGLEYTLELKNLDLKKLAAFFEDVIIKR